MRNHFILVICCLLFNGFLQAQDRHFTQFYSVASQLNPALTGAFNGNFRVSMIHRDQWRGSLEKPFQSTVLNADLRFPLASSAKGDVVAFGLNFYTDKAGVFEYSQSGIVLGGAFHKSLDYTRIQVISAGFQVEASQRNILYEDLTFQDQFNGTDGFTLPTGEDLPENNFSFGDIHLGLNYSLGVNDKDLIHFGAALHHILEPEVSFYKNDDDEIQQGVSSSKLLQRYTIHGGGLFALSRDLSISPRMFGTLQGPHAQVVIGNNFLIESSENDQFAVHFGAWIRTTRNANKSILFDSVGLLAGFNVSSFQVGLSYDINISDLQANFAGRGALELSISYFGDYEASESLCPSF